MHLHLSAHQMRCAGRCRGVSPHTVLAKFHVGIICTILTDLFGLCEIGVARENVTALMHYFQSGQDEWSTWRSIYEVMHVKTKLADSLTRRMSAANQMYSHSEISALLVSILHTIDTLVDDPETRNRINTSIHKTINLSGDDYSQSTS